MRKKIEIQNYENVKPFNNSKINAKTYDLGQILIIITTKLKGFHNGQKFKIVGIKDDETLILDTISSNKTGRDRTRKGLEFNIKDNIDFVLILKFNEIPKVFKVNEKIVFTKRIGDDANRNVTLARLGYVGKIQKIEDEFITIDITHKLDESTGKISKLKASFGFEKFLKTIQINSKENPFFEHYKKQI